MSATDLVIGIDSGKDRVDAVALRGPDVVDCLTVDLARQKLCRGLALQTLQFEMLRWLGELGEPMESTWIYIEEPIVMAHDRRVAVLLAETVGMLLALPYHTDVVPVSSWKFTAIGSGKASKDEVRKVIASRFPDKASLFGKRQDLFDATGVALYGLRLRGDG